MTTSTPDSLVLLAWLDSTGDPNVAMAAVSGGRRISPESALTRLFADGIAGVSRVLPWFAPGALRDVPICAYATVTGEAGRVRSGFVAHPSPDDIARLNSEFRSVASAAAGPSVARFVDALRPARDRAGRIEINVLEGRALCAGREVALSNGEFAVATAIALSGEALSREEWCDRLWPDRDGESAARLLKVYIHRIRTKFGIDRVIETHGRGYRIGRDVGVDVVAFEASRSASRADAVLPPSERERIQRAFEGFAERRYRRLEGLEHYAEIERRILATGAEIARMLANAAFAEGDFARALTIADHLAALDPYDEVAAELRIRAQLRLGRPDAASRSFRAFCRTLRDELDLGPPRHLAQLIQAEPVS
jgi:DNA-binding SARP family transcriptional activator